MQCSAMTGILHSLQPSGCCFVVEGRSKLVGGPACSRFVTLDDDDWGTLLHAAVVVVLLYWLYCSAYAAR